MNMKHLLNGVAVVAALAIATPVWAQTAGGNTYGGNTMGLPGPNPGGFPAPSPYDAPGGAFHQVPPRPMHAYAWTSTTSPAHHVRHAKAMHAHHRAVVQEAALTGDTAAQLNREELARIQSGAPPAPPAASMPYVPMSDTAMSDMPMPYQPNPSGGNSMGMPGPNPGGPGLTPYTD